MNFGHSRCAQRLFDEEDVAFLDDVVDDEQHFGNCGRVFRHDEDVYFHRFQ